MAEYHVGCGAFGIYAGTLNSRNKNMWRNKTECTDEAICAVRDYLVQELLGGLDCKKATSSGRGICDYHSSVSSCFGQLTQAGVPAANAVEGRHHNIPFSI